MNEGPGEHDRHLMDDDPSETVACARCGEPVWAYSQQCSHCGVYFAGEAWQFQLAGHRPRGRRSNGWYIAVIIVMVIVVLLWGL